MLRGGLLNFADVRPWYLRLLLLACIFTPLVSGGQLHPRIHVEHAFRDLLMWCLYGLFVWLFITLCVGVERLLQWLSVATILGLTVALTGGLFRKLKFWEIIEGLAGFVSGTEPSPMQQQELDLIFRLLVIMISLPLGLFALSSFPAFDIAGKLAGSKKRRESLAALGIFLRVLQHVFEVVTSMLVAWREENPRIILPRHRVDLGSWPWGGLGYLRWFTLASKTWALGMLIQSLRVVPAIVGDWSRLLDED